MSSDAYCYKVSENMNTDKRGFAMSLLEDWRNEAYDREEDPNQLKKLWDNYFEKERDIYKILLTDPSNVVTGTVKELADRFGVELKIMVGFLDGINDSLVQANPIENMDENTEVSLAFDKERLYKNMVDADADWLYNLPEWDKIFTKEERKKLYLEQKQSHTVHRAKKIGRNDMCPCGSGKKYKFCHGKKGAEPLDPKYLQ